MNLYIQRLQAGGMPFADYTPLTGVSPTQALGSAAQSTKDNDIDSNLYKLIGNMKGLPSDLAKLRTLITKFERGQLYSSINSTKEHGLAEYAAIRELLANTEFNLELFNDAKKLVITLGGLNEYAIDSVGNIQCLNKEGKVVSLSLEEYMKSIDSENPTYSSPLTNALLLDIRANVGYNYAFNNDLLKIVANGIGTVEVTKMILLIISGLGSDETKLDGYTAKLLLLIAGGFLEIENLIEKDPSALIMDGIYSTSLLNKDQKRQISAATLYLASALPNNVKTWLKLKSDGTDKGAINLALQLVSIRSGNTRNLKVSYNDDINIDGSKKSSSSTSKEGMQTNQVLNIQSMIGGDKGRYVINKGTLANMEVDGVNYRSIVDTSGKTILSTSLDNMLSSSGILGIVDNSSISFGNQVLSSDDLHRVVYKNEGGIAAILPKKINEDGKVVPWFELLDAYQEVINKVNARLPDDPSQVTYEMRQKIEKEELEKALLYLLLTTDGEINYDMFLLFFIVNGYAVSLDFKLSLDNANSKFVKIYDVDDAPEAARTIEEALTTDKLHPYTINEGLFTYDSDIYKSSIFIPIVSANKLAAVTAYGDLLKYSEGKQQESNYLRYIKQLNMKSTSPDLLK